MFRDVLPVQRTVGYDRRWWILAVLCLSLLIIGIDNTILNVALPTLSRTLHATNSQLQWIVDAYVLVFASLLLTTGSLSDRFGRRSALALGPRHLRVRLRGLRLRRQRQRPHGHPGPDGHRRGAHHAVHSVQPHHRLSARGAGPCHR